MQYTAASFAAIITEWFAFVLRPERHEHKAEGTMPRSASRSEHTPETVLEQIVEPFGRFALRMAFVARRFQHGRVQAYVLYLLVGLATLAGLVIVRGGP
jgi:hydrogenase-4 component B